MKTNQINAKLVVRYYHIYREYLWENGLDDDSKTIDVESLVNYVNSEIDTETRLRLADKIA